MQISQRGFTLIDLMTVMIVIAVLAVLAVPNFRAMIERRRLIQTAEVVQQQIALARSEAVRLHTPVCVHFTSEESGTLWALGLSPRDTPCDPTVTDLDAPGACVLPEDENRVLRALLGSTFVGMRLINPLFGDDVPYTCFEPVRRTVRNADQEPLDGSLTIISPNNEFRVRINVTAEGKIHICRPAGFTALPRYPECAD